MPTSADANAFYNELRASFPWLDSLGVSPQWIRDMIASATGPAEIVSKIRTSSQYRARFPGMFRADGTMRMTEAEYFATENSYRQLLRQYGHITNDQTYEDPASLVGWFQGDVDPNELRDRLDVFRGVQTGGQRIKDAFYVYTGLGLTDDDLYQAVVDPASFQNLAGKANQAIATQTFDYETWITRATQVGLNNVSKTLTDLRSRGAVTSEAVQQIISVAPEFARQIMDALYTGADLDASQKTLNLQELLTAFEDAAIGAAAANSGLAMPTRERLGEIRAAGIEKAKAIQGYMDFGKNKGIFNAAVMRARGVGFTQTDFESGAFLGNASAQTNLERGMAQERAAGIGGGGFRFGEEGDRIVQKGFRPSVR